MLGCKRHWAQFILVLDVACGHGEGRSCFKEKNGRENSRIATPIGMTVTAASGWGPVMYMRLQLQIAV